MVYTDGIFYVFLILFRKYINCKHCCSRHCAIYTNTTVKNPLVGKLFFSLFNLFDEKYSKIVIL